MVPEKQGLKLKEPGSDKFLTFCLSSGSRKTRIETDLSAKHRRGNLRRLSSGSRKTRIETGNYGHNLGLSQTCLSSGSRKTRIETTLAM